MSGHPVRHSLTELAVLTAHVSAFCIVPLYGLAWLLLAPQSFDWHTIAVLATWFMTLLIQRATYRDTQALHAKWGDSSLSPHQPPRAYRHEIADPKPYRRRSCRALLSSSRADRSIARAESSEHNPRWGFQGEIRERHRRRIGVMAVITNVLASAGLMQPPRDAARNAAPDAPGYFKPF